MDVVDLYARAERVSVDVNQGPIELCVSRVPFRPSTATPLSRGRLVLLHGNPASMHDFGRLAAIAARDFDVVTVDLPGFGRSGNVRPIDSESVLDTHARHVIAALDAIGCSDTSYVLGHSHGGGVAQAIAAIFPARVRALVLIGSVGTPAHWGYRALVVPGVISALKVLAKSLKLTIPRPLRRRIVRQIMTPIFSPHPLSEHWVEDQLVNVEQRPEILVNMALVATGDPCGQLARAAELIRAPALFIHGARDRLVPARYARAVYDVLARAGRAEFHELPNTGHMLQLSHPEAIHDLLVAWLTRLQVSQTLAHVAHDEDS